MEGVEFSFIKLFGSGKIIFERTHFKSNNPIYFFGVEMDSPENLEFLDVLSLDSALFLYTDLEKVKFKNVRFRKTQNRFFNREFLADEVRNLIPNDLSEKKEYDQNYFSHVEILYRQLKVNFETQRDYARAGDFHYGELEMQRKRKMLEWEERPWVRKLLFGFESYSF